jgi:hypothetical protein
MKPIAHGISNALRHAAAAHGAGIRETAHAAPAPAFSHFKSDLKTLAAKFLSHDQYRREQG